ncbi:MAG: mevalonate kinase [Nitrososphaeraceae archaeon]
MNLPNEQISYASAPAKIILFGEHFVVYEKPAILASIDKRIHIIVIKNDNKKILTINDKIFGKKSYSISDFKKLQEKFPNDVYFPILYTIKKNFEWKFDNGLEFKVNSSIPYGVGLGSSAAISVATAASLSNIFKTMTREKILELAIETEKLVHSNSSGADCIVATYGGLLFYQKNTSFKKLKLREKLSFVLVLTGIRHSTGSLVKFVKNYRSSNTNDFHKLANISENITKRAVRALEEGNNILLGQLMNENQILLEKIGVSNKIIGKIIKLCDKYEALGSKITGAGGGGCVLVLVEEETKENFMCSIRKEGFQCIPVSLETEGVIY